MRPLVTVLIATRNGALLLPETLDSVRAQTLSDWECVVVDDASDDDTPGLLERYAGSDARFRSVRNETSAGPYGAAKIGLSQARGKYIARLDGDDLAEPRRLEAQVAFLESQPDLRACTSWWRQLKPDGVLETTPRRPPVESPRTIKWAICIAAGFVHSTLCVRRDALDAVGGYRELPAAADYGLWSDLARRDWVGVVPESLVVWREHAAQMSVHRLDEQRSNGVAILARHLEDLGGGTWAPQAVDALWRSGRWEPVGLPLALSALADWERLWRADRSLTSDDRRVLSMLTRRVCGRIVKWNRHGDNVTAAREMLRWLRRRRRPTIDRR